MCFLYHKPVMILGGVVYEGGRLRHHKEGAERMLKYERLLYLHRFGGFPVACSPIGLS